MAAVCKRLEAAQRFLKQVSQLPNFGALRGKQPEGLLSLLKKTKVTKVLNLKVFQLRDRSDWPEVARLSELLLLGGLAVDVGSNPTGANDEALPLPPLLGQRHRRCQQTRANAALVLSYLVQAKGQFAQKAAPHRPRP